jgi:hypothetical protein
VIYTGLEFGQSYRLPEGETSVVAIPSKALQFEVRSQRKHRPAGQAGL